VLRPRPGNTQCHIINRGLGRGRDRPGRGHRRGGLTGAACTSADHRDRVRATALTQGTPSPRYSCLWGSAPAAQGGHQRLRRGGGGRSRADRQVSGLTGQGDYTRLVRGADRDQGKQLRGSQSDISITLSMMLAYGCCSDCRVRLS
jgi:hypothetical protein